MILTVRHKRHFLEPRLPHLIYLWQLTPERGNPEELIPISYNNKPHILLMRGDELKVELPSGYYAIRIQCGGVISLRLVSRLRKKPTSVDLSVSSTTRITAEGYSTAGDSKDPLNLRILPTQKTIEFRDRERLWNILFDIDLILWIVSLFVTFPLLYKIISDTFFIIWLIRLIIIRKRYYSIHTLAC